MNIAETAENGKHDLSAIPVVFWLDTLLVKNRKAECDTS